MSNFNSLQVWSDVNDIQTNLSSLDIKSCDETINQIEVDYKMSLPSELMENIVCYLDGITLLKFKLLSKTCYGIVQNALKYNKLWKNICLDEIPYKYFIELLNKQFNKYISLDSLSEIQYERLYKRWIKWQRNVFTITRIGEQNFLCLDEIEKIISCKLDVLVVFLNHMCIFSLIKDENKTESYITQENKLEFRKPFALSLLNPQSQTKKDCEEHMFMSCHQNYLNICPLHNAVDITHDGNVKKYNIGNLIDVDFNIYINKCCWVRESWYEWHSNSNSNITGHRCQKLNHTMYTSVVYGVIIGQFNRNSIVFHNIYKDLCITVNCWLYQKYIRATAVYIYTNILFIGTQNGYLLAYRLRCWDDLMNLKKENMLLEARLNIGQIISLDIIDFENIQAIIVATTSSAFWIKFN